MRRSIIFTVVAALCSLALTATATSGSTGYIKDRFTSIGWGGSDGSLPWSGNWVEINDDGDEKFGDVRVVASANCADGNCIRITKGLITSNIGAKRTADTSYLEDVSLCYDLTNLDAGIDLGLVHLLVQVNSDGEWVTLADYDLGEEFSGHFTHDDMDEFASEQMMIRFLVTGPLLPSEVYIDNVEIEGTIVETETTTTTIDASTTTTNAGATTTTKPRTTTTEPHDTTTSTSVAGATSTTATASSTSSTIAGPDRSSTPGGVSTTTTTTPGTGAEDGSQGDPAIGPDGTGIRAAARGLQASFQGDLYGDVRTISSLGGVDLQADYNMAVEVIKATWAWVVVLGLLIAWAIVSGLERRRDDIEG